VQKGAAAMNWSLVDVEQFSAKIVDLWDSQGMLLCSGDYHSGDFNAMTVGWGSFGVMWGRPFAQVVVRPTRYTFQFMEKYETYTLTAFSPQHRGMLQFMGSRSGRNVDKVKAAGLTPAASHIVAAPLFAEAQLAIECRKIYWQDIDPAHFVDAAIDAHYPRKDYHRVYFGDILCIREKVPGAI
jgi:flavin reductase (DIM6/NTAB) family NADH-FMN oxidoreductase RutF